MIALDPFVLTPLNITVIRLTHDGMPVKSNEVPEVDATAVPETSGYMLVVTPLDVTGPEDSKSGVVIPFVPSRTIAIHVFQETTQRDPLGTVTTTPDPTTTGPALMALSPAASV